MTVDDAREDAVVHRRVHSSVHTPSPVASNPTQLPYFRDDPLLPPFVDAGEEESGRMVLDSLSAHGSIGLAQPGKDLPCGGTSEWWDS